jgi:predicted permease
MFISPPEKTYRQTLLLRISLLVIVALVPLFVFAAFDFEPRKMSAAGWGIIAAALGLYVFAWWAISKSLLTIHPEGVAYTTAFGGKEVRWEDIHETFYYKMD